MEDIQPEAINADILHLFTLKAMVNHLQIILNDIDLEVDPSLIQASDLDLMPELYGDLKTSLGAVVQITARMFLMDKPSKLTTLKPII